MPDAVDGIQYLLDHVGVEALHYRIEIADARSAAVLACVTDLQFAVEQNDGEFNRQRISKSGLRYLEGTLTGFTHYYPLPVGQAQHRARQRSLSADKGWTVNYFGAQAPSYGVCQATE